MKKAKILHNPEAGEGETSKRELIETIRSAGFKCSYSSTKETSWENIEAEEFDFVVLAGGDGTVRKIAEELLERKILDKKLPIGLLPIGTANNIARTLGLSGETIEIVKRWHDSQVKKFDVGRISGLQKPTFFLESFGYGLFPRLMKKMEKRGNEDMNNPKEKIKAALEILHELILSAEVKNCKIQIDEKDYSGEFLLIEVMNIRSIGPNLSLATEADPGDGKFDVVLITENQRQDLADYVQKKINGKEGKEVEFSFPILKAKNLNVLWEGKYVHVDDEYYKLDSPVKVKIELREGLLEFLVPLKTE